MTKRLERKISVDVRGMNEEQKKRVQDCFFKLGYKWYLHGRSYQHLDVKEYTNTYDSGILDDNLMYGCCGIFSVPPITLEELERITAEFTGEDNNMTKEDLQNGMLVEYRNGELRMVWNGSLFNSVLDKKAFLLEYNDDLIHRDSSSMDIVGIYEHSTTTPLSFTKGNLIWTGY